MSIDNLVEIPEEQKVAAIKAFEAYLGRHRDEMGSVLVGGRHLTYDELLEEMKKGTAIGLRYLKTIIEGGVERYKV